ncbi:hypothetical protein THOM_0584 [Trachipleistophora hominis]|uniref:Uncharacterized protein n=1 Tax=Trachipleistophora hominis TaxID=72359 RepID=L7JY89_TRAHO|nr:hypothetical protein THOM_0584 [Trachipleistophora hominis]
MKSKSMKELINIREAIKRENSTFKTNLMNELNIITHNKKKEIKALLQRKQKRLTNTKKEITALLNDFNAKAIIADLNSKIEKFNVVITKRQKELEKQIAKIRKIKSTCFTEIERYLEELKGVQNENIRAIDKQATHVQKNLERFTREKDNASDRLFYNVTKR